MSKPNLNISTVDQQAMEWVKSLPNASDDTREAFGFWIRRSPEHLSAFLKHQLLETELQNLEPEHHADLDTYLDRAKTTSKIVRWPGAAASGAGSAEIASRPANAGVRRTSLRWKWLATGVAAAALLWSAPWWYQTLVVERPAVYTTGIGQQKRIVLPDGSSIELNTQSSVRVQLLPTSRNVYLLGGEALFNVKHNASVPFRVHADGTLIEDLGTQFNVHRRGDATTVSVIEGLVQVSAEHHGTSDPSSANHDEVSDVVVTTKEFQPLRQPARLSAGEQASIVADGTLMQKRALNIAQATAWRHGRVVFSGATLEEIVAEFNRYNVRKIRIHGDALREKRYTGVFDARDPESFIDYLRQDAGIEIEDSNDGLVLR